MADLLQPTEKSGHVGRIGSGRRGAEKPDQRHCWLLRARYERPRRRCAEQRDKFAAFHPPPRWERATRITVAHHSAAGARCAAKYPVGSGLQWVLVVRKRAGGRTSTDRFRREAAVGLLSKI